MKIQIKGIKGGRDRRGLTSLTYKFLFTESTVEEALVAGLPITINLPEVGRQLGEWEVDNNGFNIDATFEGILSEPSPDQDQYSIDGEWREEPIESFPYLNLLREKFGAYEDPDTGRIKFPEIIESPRGGSGLGGTTEEKNPLYGTTTYPVKYHVAVRTLVRSRIPSNIYTDVGKVTQSLPGGFENPPPGPWIKDPVKTRKRGNSREIVEKWRQVDKLKHLEALQLLIAGGGR